MIRRSVLIGTGSALPKRAVSNAEMAQMVDTSDEWIVERTGIRNRHIAGEGETTSTLATAAARSALEDLTAASFGGMYRPRPLMNISARPAVVSYGPMSVEYSWARAAPARSVDKPPSVPPLISGESAAGR